MSFKCQNSEAKAIKGNRGKVQLATKFGVGGVYNPGGPRTVHGDPEYVRAACEASLKRLYIDCIDLYYQHHLDTSAPIEITVGAMKKLVEEGKVKYLGLSEASVSKIRRAHAVHLITAVQIDWSHWARDVEVSHLQGVRTGIVPYSPLRRGLFAGTIKLEDLGDHEFPKVVQNDPFFQGENWPKQNPVETCCQNCRDEECTTSQLAIAWVIHKGAFKAVPIPGTTKIANLESNIASLGIKLTEDSMKALEDAVPASEVAGDKYMGEMLARS